MDYFFILRAMNYFVSLKLVHSRWGSKVSVVLMGAVCDVWTMLPIPSYWVNTMMSSS
jgi:hypothetical protein